jgi:hypothetical protein
MVVSSLPPVVCRMVHILLCCLCLLAYSGVRHFVLSFVSTFLDLCCDARYDFLREKMFDPSLPPVVFRRADILFMLSVFTCV